jgi:hypothetical protein
MTMTEQAAEYTAEVTPPARPWKTADELDALFAPLGFEHCGCSAEGGCYRIVLPGQTMCLPCQFPDARPGAPSHAHGYQSGFAAVRVRADHEALCRLVWANLAGDEGATSAALQAAVRRGLGA